MKMDAVILAGGKLKPDDPLYPISPNGARCLIELQGKPMVQWVIDALNASEMVENLYLIGLPDDTRVESSKPLNFLPDQNDLFKNIHSSVLHVTRKNPSHSKVIIASGDLPAVTAEMIDWLVKQVADQPDYMLYYNVITRETMEEQFPRANRSFVHLKDVSVCGGDLNVVDRAIFDVEKPIWHKLAEARKSPLKLASLLGFDSLIMVALRLVTLDQAVQKICKRLSVTGKALICPFAEMAMDADKPHQIALLRDYLKGK